MNIPAYIQKRRQGISLVEVVIAGAIAVVIVAGFSLFIIYYLQSYQFSFNQNIAIGTAERSVRQLIDEIRQARVAQSGAYPLAITNDQELGFYADIDNDDEAEYVHYTLQGTDLYRGIIEPIGIPPTYPSENEISHIIADNIRNNTDPIFYYYNSDWPGDTVNNPLIPSDRLLETALLRVVIRVNVDTDTLPAAFELSSATHIRNLKTNL